MTPTFKKLNFKNHKEIVVLNMPDSFKAEVLEMSKEATLFYARVGVFTNTLLTNKASI